MKKFLPIILILIFCTFAYLWINESDGYKIIKVNSADEFYIDYNKNQIPEEKELCILYYVRSFKPQQDSEYNQVETAKLSYLADEFARKKLLNKTPVIQYDEYRRVKTVTIDGQDYAKILMDKGFASANTSIENNPYFEIKNKIQIANNLSTAAKLQLVSFNPHSKNYHKLDCKHAFDAASVIILEEKDLPKDAKKCKICHSKKVKKSYPRTVLEKYKPLFVNDVIEIYVSDFTKYFYPSSHCTTTVCKSLLNRINNSKETIDFAVYGIYNQPEIINAKKKAKDRGVKIRWVYDLDSAGNSIYPHTKNTVVLLSNARSDIENRYPNAIMHNKFFIFDNSSVWLGSANISDTDLSGFNANTVLYIKSAEIASIYRKEFEQMYSGSFHKDKSKTLNNENIKLGQSVVSVYFSPQDKSMTKKIIPLVQNAKKYIYIPIFVITDKILIQELTEAKSRGVDVLILTDATGAANKYSPIAELRKAGFKVKVEDRPGKLHTKAMIIDDEYLIAGSMNFSKSGENYNDENIVIIKDKEIARIYKRHFMHLWNSVPDKWLYKSPSAESFSSINSCYDGIDNDFDGKIDAEDDGCKIKH